MYGGGQKGRHGNCRCGKRKLERSRLLCTCVHARAHTHTDKHTEISLSLPDSSTIEWSQQPQDKERKRNFYNWFCIGHRFYMANISDHRRALGCLVCAVNTKLIDINYGTRV